MSEKHVVLKGERTLTECDTLKAPAVLLTFTLALAVVTTAPTFAQPRPHDASTIEPPVTGRAVDEPSPVDAQTDKSTGQRGEKASDKDAKKPGAADVQATPTALVIEVAGSVDWASPGVSPLASDGWTPVRLDDRLAPGTQVRTGLRSHLNLRFGETTFVSVRSATHASIDLFFRSATTENVRIGLAYGTVRGSSTEGRLRSDVIVDSTVAILAKRGTEGWEIRVEPMTGRFKVSLAEYGLVEAIQKLAGDRRLSRTLRPGEYATPDNIANMWIRQAVFDRVVTFYEASSITEADADFTVANSRGFGTLAPGGGTSLVDLSGRVSAEFVLEQTAAGTAADVPAPTTALLQRTPVRRAEGNFGPGDSFRVLLPAATDRSVRRLTPRMRPLPGRLIRGTRR